MKEKTRQYYVNKGIEKRFKSLPCVDYQLIKAGYQTCTNFSMLTSDALNITARVRITRGSCDCRGHPLNECPGHSPGIYYVYMYNLLQPSTHANQTDTSDMYYRRQSENSQGRGHQLGFLKREKKNAVQRDREKVVRLSRWQDPEIRCHAGLNHSVGLVSDKTGLQMKALAKPKTCRLEAYI